MPDELTPDPTTANPGPDPQPVVSLPESEDLTFILDTPSDKDVLDVHTPVAKAITEVIRTRKSIKMIGLLGGWGSGKSTVANLAREQLEAEANSPVTLRCFTFDAWVHQSDPPRLAFLDALADYVRTDTQFKDLQEALLDTENPPKWRKTLDDLKVQAETNTTTTTPTLTKAGRWLAFALVITMPLGFKLIGDGTLSLAEQRDPSAFALFFLGWFGAALPGLVLLIFYLAWRRWNEVGQIKTQAALRDFFVRHRDAHRDDSVLAVVSGKTVESRHESRHKTPDPTAIEFQGAFREMIAAVHTGGRRLVIIVDNLDRLPPAEAKVFWSTVRSLFLGTDAGRPIKREDLPTVLMPIDAGSIEKIYEGKPDDPEKLSQSFLEKTFDLIFYVPAPILSRWHRYLHLKLREVFGDKMPTHWSTLIGGIYERHLDGKRPTPRSINGFVNALAAIWLQREGDRIDIGIIAYYVTVRDALVKDYDAALEADVDELTAIDAEWRRDIAALHYGLNRTDAAELAMADPIRDALIAYDETRFIEKFGLPGFERYFLKVLRTPDADGRTIPVLGVAFLLSRRPVQPWTTEAWRLLRMIAAYIPNVGTIAAADVDGLQALLDSGTDVERKSLARRLLDLLGGYSEKAITGDGAKHFAQLAEVVLAASAPGSDDRVQAPGQSREYIRILTTEPPLDVLRRIRPPGGDFNAIRDELVARLSNLMGAADVGLRAKTLRTVAPTNMDWAPLMQAIGDALQAPEAWRASAALDAIVRLYEPLKPLAERLEEWQADGRLAQASNVLWTEASEKDVANIVAVMIAAKQMYSPTGAPTWTERLKASPDLPKRAEQALSEMNWSFNLAGLLKMGAATDAEAPLRQALAAYALDSDGAGALKLNDVFEDTPRYLTLPDDLQRRLWNALAERPDYWKGLVESPAAAQRQVLAALIKHLKGRGHLGKVVAAHLNAAPSGEWADAIHNGGGPWGVVDAIRTDMSHSQGRLGERAFRGLRDTLQTVVETSDDSVRERWFATAARLEAALRETLFKSLAGVMAPLAGKSDVLRILELGGSDLSNLGLSAQPDRTMVDIVIPMAGHEEGRRWLAAHAAEVRDWVGGADPGSRDTLLAILTGVSGDANADALLTALKSRPIPQPPPKRRPKSTRETVRGKT